MCGSSDGSGADPRSPGPTAGSCLWVYQSIIDPSVYLSQSVPSLPLPLYPSIVQTLLIFLCSHRIKPATWMDAHGCDWPDLGQVSC